jgi:hypothetical protein
LLSHHWRRFGSYPPVPVTGELTNIVLPNVILQRKRKLLKWTLRESGKTRLPETCADARLPANRAAATDFEQLPAIGVSASIAMTLVLTLTPAVCLLQSRDAALAIRHASPWEMYLN